MVNGRKRQHEVGLAIKEDIVKKAVSSLEDVSPKIPDVRVMFAPRSRRWLLTYWRM